MFMNPWLLTDFYKLTHILQYRPELRELTSYLTPRGSRLKGVNKVVFFGLSAYVHSYVVENFNKNFFNRNFEDCEREIREVLNLGLGYSDEMIDRTINAFRALHERHYLPVEIKAVAEGTLVPMGVPCLEIKSTDPQFFWVGQALEASLSAAIWHPMVSATIAREYRKIAREAFAKTVENGIDERTAMCDFSMRGQESNESAVNASVAWLTSMWNSSTVAARKHIQNVYGKCDGNVRGLTSTEHSVMTSHACLDGGDEIPTFKYLFKLYKDVSFAAVCDSYDFWNVLTNILPNNFMKEIDDRGKRGVFIGVRHDSADPVEAICGTVESGGTTWEEKGMVETMYEIFGGTVNSKGYKVLNPGIKAVYGDSITVTRAKEIYKRLEAKGFAANNVSLGVGSLSFQALENEDGTLSPFTRDTFSVAIKCTHSKYVTRQWYDSGYEGDIWHSNVEEAERHVFKDPKDFSGKKSQKGLCRIFFNEDGELTYEDELYEADLVGKNSALVPYFKDGQEFKQNFESIRETIDETL
jgi:nicotinamide phosphoribosyltransferase